MKKKVIFGLLILLNINIVLFADITAKEAEEIAINDSKIERNNATRIFSRKDFEDGRSVYNVAIFDGEGKYEYEIDAASGAIYEFEYDKDKRGNRDISDRFIDKEQAFLVALEDAGLLEKDISRKRVELDRDEGTSIFEVEFKTNDFEYSYDINAETGAIISGSYEKRGRIKSNKDDSLISIAQAENIVRSLVDTNADYVKVRKDFDDGVVIYESDMHVNGLDYEVEINASTGEVISFSWENWSNR